MALHLTCLTLEADPQSHILLVEFITAVRVFAVVIYAVVGCIA